MGNFAGLDRLFAELKRRHIYRVAASYAVLAWLLLQIVNNVAPVLAMPPWVARSILLLLFLGFPVALFFAWMRELPPADATGQQSATTKLDYGLMGALVLVIALVSYQQHERFLDYHEREVQIQYMPDLGKAIWTPDAATIRKTERFKGFARASGLVAAWRANGWPDLCRPVGTDDFVCD